MVHIPDLRAIGALEEPVSCQRPFIKKDWRRCIPVVARSIISIRRLEYRPRLHPAARRRRIAAVPGQQPELVAGGPAVAGGIGQVRLAATVHGRGALLHGGADGLPGGGGLGEDLDAANAAGGVERGDAQGLKAIAHAGEDEVIAGGEAEDGAVDAPGSGELREIAPAVPRSGAA